MINTMNESRLHRTLKTLYAEENEGSVQEAKAGKYIADVLTADGNVIEIQTGSLSHLLAKCMYYIAEKRRVTVVYPLAVSKTIRTLDPAEGSEKVRKSPKKQDIYGIFRELTSLCPVLLDRNFTLEVLEVRITENRIRTAEPVQSKNGRRRRPQNWQKTDKSLDEIIQRHVFHGKKSYLDMLPENLPETFSFSEFYAALSADKKVKKEDARLMLWVYSHTGLVEYRGKQGRLNMYALSGKGTKKTPRKHRGVS